MGGQPFLQREPFKLSQIVSTENSDGITLLSGESAQSALVRDPRGGIDFH